MTCMNFHLALQVIKHCSSPFKRSQQGIKFLNILKKIQLNIDKFSRDLLVDKCWNQTHVQPACFMNLIIKILMKKKATKRNI